MSYVIWVYLRICLPGSYSECDGLETFSYTLDYVSTHWGEINTLWKFCLYLTTLCNVYACFWPYFFQVRSTLSLSVHCFPEFFPTVPRIPFWFRCHFPSDFRKIQEHSWYPLFHSLRSIKSWPWNHFASSIFPGWVLANLAGLISSSHRKNTAVTAANIHNVLVNPMYLTDTI